MKYLEAIFEGRAKNDDWNMAIKEGDKYTKEQKNGRILNGGILIKRKMVNERFNLVMDEAPRGKIHINIEMPQPHPDDRKAGYSTHFKFDANDKDEAEEAF